MQLTQDEQFFYDNAGFSYEPGKESQEDGHIRCARRLATAEAYARNADWWYEWLRQDWQECGCQLTSYHEVWTCILFKSESRREVLAALGSICQPSSKYRRVIRAELAMEAMSQICPECEAIGHHKCPAKD